MMRTVMRNNKFFLALKIGDLCYALCATHIFAFMAELLKVPLSLLHQRTFLLVLKQLSKIQLIMGQDVILSIAPTAFIIHQCISQCASLILHVTFHTHTHPPTNTLTNFLRQLITNTKNVGICGVDGHSIMIMHNQGLSVWLCGVIHISNQNGKANEVKHLLQLMRTCVKFIKCCKQWNGKQKSQVNASNHLHFT